MFNALFEMNLVTWRIFRCTPLPRAHLYESQCDTRKSKNIILNFYFRSLECEDLSVEFLMFRRPHTSYSSLKRPQIFFWTTLDNSKVKNHHLENGARSALVFDTRKRTPRQIESEKIGLRLSDGNYISAGLRARFISRSLMNNTARPDIATAKLAQYKSFLINITSAAKLFTIVAHGEEQ